MLLKANQVPFLQLHFLAQNNDSEHLPLLPRTFSCAHFMDPHCSGFLACTHFMYTHCLGLFILCTHFMHPHCSGCVLCTYFMYPHCSGFLSCTHFMYPHYSGFLSCTHFMYPHCPGLFLLCTHFMYPHWPGPICTHSMQPLMSVVRDVLTEKRLVILISSLIKANI